MRVAFFEQASGVADSVVVIGLIAHKRHVGDDVRARVSANDSTRVIDDIFDRDGQRGVVSLDYVAQAIADQKHVDISERGQACKGVIVGSHHR